MKFFEKKLLLLVVVLVVAAVFPAFSEGGVIFGFGLDEAYIELEDAFDFGQYDEAEAVLEKYPNLLLTEYADSKKYSTYLEALDYLETGEYYIASQLFDSLKDFRDSTTMAYYAAGRDAEKNGEYEDAEALFRECSTYADAKERMIACGEKKTEALIKEADELYMRGVGSKSIADLESAYEIYKSVGADGEEKAAKCLEDISAIRKREEYDEAVADYENAEKDGNSLKVQELMVYFESLGDYESSERYAARAQAYIDNLNREFSVEIIEVTQNEITVWIRDTSLLTHDYEISCTCVNAPAGTVYDMKGDTHVFKDLVCGTEYLIRAGVKGDSEVTDELTIKTKPAQLYTEHGFDAKRDSLLGLKRSYLNRYTFEEIRMEHPNNLQKFNDFVVSPEDTYLSLQQTVYLYQIYYTADEDFAGEKNVQWVIRTKSAGVYAGECMQNTNLQSDGYVYFYLEQIMDEIYENLGSWPHESMMIELYIDGKLASQGYVVMRQN